MNEERKSEPKKKPRSCPPGTRLLFSNLLFLLHFLMFGFFCLDTSSTLEMILTVSLNLSSLNGIKLESNKQKQLLNKFHFLFDLDSSGNKGPKQEESVIVRTTDQVKNISENRSLVYSTKLCFYSFSNFECLKQLKTIETNLKWPSLTALNGKNMR